MNNQAEQVLTQLLQRAVDGVDKAVEFSQAQIPDVIEQLLLWHGVYSGVLFFTCVAITAGVLYLSVKMVKVIIKETKKSYYEQKDSRTIVPALAIAAMFLGVALLTKHMANLDWLQILIAPKLYLLEYAAELVK